MLLTTRWEGENCRFWVNPSTINTVYCNGDVGTIIDILGSKKNFYSQESFKDIMGKMLEFYKESYPQPNLPSNFFPELIASSTFTNLYNDQGKIWIKPNLIKTLLESKKYNCCSVTLNSLTTDYLDIKDSFNSAYNKIEKSKLLINALVNLDQNQSVQQISNKNESKIGVNKNNKLNNSNPIGSGNDLVAGLTAGVLLSQVGEDSGRGDGGSDRGHSHDNGHDGMGSMGD